MDDVDQSSRDDEQPPDFTRFAEQRATERAARRVAARKRVRRQRLIVAGVVAAVVILFLGFVWPAFFLGAGGPGTGGSGSHGATGAAASPSATVGGSGEPSSAGSKPSIGIAGGGAASASGGASGSADGSPGAPKPLRTPTAQLPLRLKLYGDSVGGDLAWAMYMKSPDHPLIKYWKFARPATGIVRPDYFSWPKYFRADLAHHSYGAVIFMSGANDGQGMVVDGRAQAFGSASWLKEYHRRVGVAMDIFLNNRVKRVYWVGMPAMGDPQFSALMADINRVSKAEAEKRAPHVRWIDAWTILSGSGGGYVAAYRQPDGVHLSDSGSFRLADAVYRIVEKEWHIGKAATASPSSSPSL